VIIFPNKHGCYRFVKPRVERRAVLILENLDYDSIQDLKSILNLSYKVEWLRETDQINTLTFLSKLINYVQSARQIQKLQEGNSAGSTTVVNRELEDLAAKTTLYKSKFESLSRDTLDLLNLEYDNSSGLRIPYQYPYKIHVRNHLNAIICYCEQLGYRREDAQLSPTPLSSSTKKEIKRILGLTDTFIRRFTKLAPPVQGKLHEQYWHSRKLLFNKEDSFNLQVKSILNSIIDYCKNAADRDDDSASNFLDLECWLANEFESFGGEVKVTEQGKFEKLLKIFRKECDISGFSSYHVNKQRVATIQQRRKTPKYFS